MSSNSIDKIIRQFKQQRPLRSKSLIVTLFGDVVETFGCPVWLGVISDLLLPLGINERLVRTSLFRLCQEGWLQNQLKGRRSYYCFSEFGGKEAAVAEKRIYYPTSHAWSGEWRMVYATGPNITAGQKIALRDRLKWLGFGTIAPNVYGHPVIDVDSVKDAIAMLGLSDKVVFMLARNESEKFGPDTWEMVKQCCQCDELERSYQKFIKKYSLVLANPDDVRKLEPEKVFLLRLLLINDYRRIVLNDPMLPSELLVQPWSGHEARDLCKRIYNEIYTISNGFYLENVKDKDSAKTTPKLKRKYLNRFDADVSLKS